MKTSLKKKPTNKAKKTKQTALNLPCWPQAKTKVINTVIKPCIAYAYYTIPFTKPDIGH